MRDCRSGAPTAWDLILAERDSLMRVALARTGNRHDAEDLVQEAMARAAVLPDLQHRTAGSLLRTIVINLSIDQHRRAATQNRYESRLSADARTVAPVDEEVCDRSEARWLREVIQEADGRDQQVLLQRAAGHSVRSSAERLGLSYKAAESAFTRARRRARHAWEATLAVLLGSVEALRRAHRAAPATGVVLAAGFTFAVSYSPPPVPGRPPVVEEQPGARALFVERLSAEPAHRASSRQLRPSRKGSVAARRVIDTGELGDRSLVSTGVAVEDAHAEETLVETVERCFHRGVVVTPTLVDCR